MMLDVCDIGLGADGLAGDSSVLRCSQKSRFRYFDSSGSDCGSSIVWSGANVAGGVTSDKLAYVAAAAAPDCCSGDGDLRTVDGRYVFVD